MMNSQKSTVCAPTVYYKTVKGRNGREEDILTRRNKQRCQRGYSQLVKFSRTRVTVSGDHAYL